ncbi:MAG: condensin complex protein MksE [Prevotella sp.]|jgi:hypothetical protein
MKYTKEIFQRLSKGQFISSNSIDPDVRSLYNDLEEHQQAYADYFSQIDFELSVGEGYYYFSRREPKVNVENKLQAMFSWIDILDALKTFDTSFTAGTQFSLVQIETRCASDPDLKAKISSLYKEEATLRGKIEKLAEFMVNKGFAEQVSEADGIYQATTAFHYIEQIILTININEEAEREIPE